MNILVAEDRPDVLELIVTVLKGAGHSVISAQDGAEALMRARESHPDIILMDLMMRGVTGFQAFDMLRESEDTRYIPIIALTAKAQQGDRESILAMGFDGYIAKPFRIKTLVNEVNEFIAKLCK